MKPRMDGALALPACGERVGVRGLMSARLQHLD
jgi:hypothetical protein